MYRDGGWFDMDHLPLGNGVTESTDEDKSPLGKKSQNQPWLTPASLRKYMRGVGVGHTAVFVHLHNTCDSYAALDGALSFGS